MLKFIVILALAPAVSGLITKIKNNLRMRKGPGVLQPYFDIMKLFAKEEVISKDSSIIFRIAPFIVFASAAVAALIVPSIVPINSISYIGDILAVFFILALGRFFMALAGLDAGSAFGGMGSSRDMFVSSFAEPAAFL
ncbi:MAG: NADH-quinone oxidoreductase subunit H, partial [Candidatus Margulisiibacteriota bacterium]